MDRIAIDIDKDVLWAEAAAWRMVSTWAYIIENKLPNATLENLYACVLEQKERVSHVVSSKELPMDETGLINVPPEL